MPNPDPDEILSVLLACAHSEMWPDDSEIKKWPRGSANLAANLISLDAWLSKGGRLPTRWREAKPTQSEKAEPPSPLSDDIRSLSESLASFGKACLEAQEALSDLRQLLVDFRHDRQS